MISGNGTGTGCRCELVNRTSPSEQRRTFRQNSLILSSPHQVLIVFIQSVLFKALKGSYPASDAD